MKIIIKYICIYVILGLMSPAFCEEEWDLNHPSVVEKNKDWQRVLKGGDFRQKSLFERMLHIEPKPSGDFVSMGEAVCQGSEDILHKSWLNQWLKGEALGVFLKVPVTAYHLSDGSEPSLLLYEKEIDGNKYCIQSSDSVVLLTVKPDSFSEVDGVSKDYVRRLISSGINIKNLENDPFGLDEEGGMLPIGWVASNNLGVSIDRIRDWSNDVTIIVSKYGVSFMFFKMDPDAPNPAFSFESDNDWLNKRLVGVDGFLVDPRYTFVREVKRTRVRKAEEK